MKKLLGGALALGVLLTACSQDKAPKTLPPSVQVQPLSTAFSTGSLIIPMDETYQTDAWPTGTTAKNDGTLLAFGLVDTLLRKGIPVNWIATTGKTQATVDITVDAKDHKSGTSVTGAKFKSGPFVIDSAYATTALGYIDTWQGALPACSNNQHACLTNVFVASAGFNADVRRTLTAAPHLAVFIDGNEDIAFGYLNAAKVLDSSGNAWPTAKCAATGCATEPDALLPSQVAGVTGVNDSVLVNADGTTNYCNITSMHYNFANNDTTQIEVVREVRRWLTGRPTHAFMECEAATTFETQTNGHFLTSNGFSKGTGNAYTGVVQVPDSLFAQYDDTFTTVGGSLPDITVPGSSSLDATDSVLVNGGSNTHIAWLTGFLDGSSANGRVSYLVGHDYRGAGGTVSLPIASNASTNGIRLFLDSLYASPCTASEGQPTVTLTKSAPATSDGGNITFTLSYGVSGPAPAETVTVSDTLATGLSFVSCTSTAGTCSATGQVVTASLGNLASGASGTVTIVASTTTDGSYTNQATASYKLLDQSGTSKLTVSSNTTTTLRDTKPPDTTITSGPPSQSTSSSASFTVTATDPSPSSGTGPFQCSLDGAAFTTCPGGGGSSFTFTGLADGSHTLQVRATDAAGNVDPTPASQTWTIDSSTSVAISSPSNGANLSASPTSISGTAEAGDTVVVTLDGSPLCSVTATGGTWSCTVSTVLSNGSHTASATATDGVGNSASAASTFGVNAGALVSISSPADGSTLTSAPTQISGTATAGSTVSVTLNGTPVCTNVGVGVSGTWSCAVSGAVPNGPYSAVATDTLSGNSATATANFTVNAPLPGAPVITVPANGSSSKSGSVTFSGTAAPNTTVNVTVGSTSCTATVSATGSWSCGVTLVDGSYLASATDTDGHGNTGPASTVAFAVDTQPPDTAITSGPPSLSNSSSATFSVSSSDPAPSSGSGPYLCSLDGAAFTPCPMSGGQVSLSGVSDGTHTLQVAATDAAGNVDPTPASDTWTVDATAPAAPTFTAPAQGSSVSTPTPSVQGTAEPGSTVFVSEAGTSICTAVTDGTGHWSCTSPALIDGSHTFSATAHDSAGNVSAPANDTFTVDTVAPDTTITSGPPAVSNSSAANFTFTSNEASATFECSLDGAAFATCTTPLAESGLSDGAHELDVRAVDAAGNVDPTPARYRWTIDTTAPVAPSFTSPTQGAVLATNTPALTGTAEPGASVALTVDGVTVATVTADANGNWSYPLAPAQALSDGSHTAIATATDAAGNTSAPASVTFTTDTQPPDTTITSGPPSTSSSSSASFAFTSSEPNSTFVCSLDGAAFAPCPDPDTLTGLADGAHTFQVAAVDAAGNVDPTPASETWTVSTTGGVLAIDSPANGSDINTASPTSSGTAPAGTVTVSVDGTAVCANATVTAGTWSCPLSGLGDGSHTVSVTDTNGDTATSTFSVDTQPPDTSFTTTPPTLSNSSSATFGFASTEPGSTFRCSLDGASFTSCNTPDTLSGLADGQHTFAVEAVDAAGNVDPTPASDTWTIDTGAPLQPVLTSPGDGSSVGTGTPPYLGTGEPGTTVTVTVDGNPTCTATVAADGSWSCTSSTGLGEGTHTVNVTGTDGSGNTSTSPTTTFTVDTTPPDTTITQAPIDGTTQTTATFAFSSNEAGVTYVCSLDGAAFTACSDPSTFSGLTVGSHTFQVAAVDAAGNQDPTPASDTWSIVAGSGFTIDTPAHGGAVNTGTPTIGGSGTPGDTVTVVVDGTTECSGVVVDSSGQWTCTVPANSPLPDGPHDVVATETDSTGAPAGQASSGFTVDTSPPDTFITSGPPAHTTSTDASFAFSSSESGVTYRCSLDGAPFASCPNPDGFSGIALGTHTLQVEAVDAAGNVDPTPAAWTWTVSVVVTTTSSSSSSSSGSVSGASTSGSSSSASSGSSGSTTATNANGTTGSSASTNAGGTSGNSGSSNASTSGSGSGSGSTTSGSSASASTSGSGSGSGATTSGSSASTGSSGSSASSSGSTGVETTSGSSGSGASGSGSTGGSIGASGGASGGNPVTNPGTLGGGGCGCSAGSTGEAGLLWVLGLVAMIRGSRRRR